MQDAHDVLVKIRALAGNGMLTHAERFDRIEALLAEGRARLEPPAEKPTEPPGAPSEPPPPPPAPEPAPPPEVGPEAEAQPAPAEAKKKGAKG